MEVTAAKNPQKELTFENFSRAKFTELKAKYPQKTDKDIFSMVNKQWQTKSKTQRQSSASSVKMGINLIQAESQPIIPRKLEYLEDKMKEESKKEQIKEESQKFSENSSIKATPVKSFKKKVIQKQVKTPSKYNAFYKFYYKKLHEEHPRWTREQINKIVNLLWRRSLQQIVSKKKHPTKRQRILRKMGGRAYFGHIKREQGLNNQQISKLWKMLPAETKKYFGLLGQGKDLNTSPVKSTGTTNITFQSRIPSSKSSGVLGFLHKSM